VRRRPRGLAPWALAALLAAVVPAGLAAADAPPELAEVRSGPLAVHYLPGYEAVAVDLARRGPGDLARVSQALGLPPPQHLDVYLLPRRAPVDPTAWGLPLGPQWAAGLALSGRPVIVLRTADELGPYGNEVARVLVHELVHAVSSEALGARYAEIPAWLREGTASYLSFDWGLADSARSVRNAVLGEAQPFAELADGFPADAERAQQAYLQSFAFVAWLVDEHGPDALRTAYRRVAAGQPFHAAFREAFGGPVSSLERHWRRHYLVLYRWVPVITSTTTLWLGVTALFVLAAVRRRRRNRVAVEGWEDEAAGVGEEDDGAEPGGLEARMRAPAEDAREPDDAEETPPGRAGAGGEAP